MLDFFLFVFHYCSLVSFMCFKINEIQTVKILVNYAALVESVEHENPAFQANFYGQNQDDTK